MSNMDLGIVYENIQPKIRNTAGPQSQNQVEAKNSKRSRWFVVITVCLVIFCVLLAVALILLYIHFRGERDQLQKEMKFLTDALVKNASGLGTYSISNEKKNWTDSRQFCRDRGGDLIIINTEEEQKFISSLVNERVWIGLSDTENEGDMKWVDNTPLNKAFWHQGEPNHLNNNEDCVEIWIFPETAVTNWNDLPCSEKRTWICEN